MKTILKHIFIDNWHRKAISAILAVIIWLLVNQSMISTKTINNIPVRVINIPAGKTIMDLQGNGLLTKKISLTLFGNKTLLDEITPSDLEIVIDASNKQGEWIATITKRNLISLNPDIDVAKGINRISHASVIIRLTKLVSEKIPIVVTQPVGEAPRGYQYLAIWPNQLTVSISGPEEMVKRLKIKGVSLTYDLSDISKAELDALQTKQDSEHADEVSFFVPDAWKRVSIPAISETPIEIDDPKAKELRIDFVRVSLLSLKASIPISLYFPLDVLEKINPNEIALTSNSIIQSVEGVFLFSKPLFAKGVNQRFLEIISDRIELVILVQPASEKNSLEWNIQLVNPRLLEDRFVNLCLADLSLEEVKELLPQAREEYLRTQFRSFVNHFQLYTSEDKRLDLNVTLENNQIVLQENAPKVAKSSL